MPYFKQHPNGESEEAEKMFQRFLSEGFSYEDISNHPDYPVYASTKFLKHMLPLMIEEMLLRNDTENFLVYHIISAIDPEVSTNIMGSDDQYNLKRAQEIVSLADKKFAEKAYDFLVAIKSDPPNDEEQIKRLLPFWKKKLEELEGD